jgi:hypothetical protein
VSDSQSSAGGAARPLRPSIASVVRRLTGKHYLYAMVGGLVLVAIPLSEEGRATDGAPFFPAAAARCCKTWRRTTWRRCARRRVLIRTEPVAEIPLRLYSFHRRFLPPIVCVACVG